MAENIINRIAGQLPRLGVGKPSDLILGISVIAILMVMLFPMPTFVLDLSLTLNITMSVIVILTALYTLRPLDFSIFPSLLLILTLFRLALNVASTRLILLNGYEGPSAAGGVIQAFGSFVVGGNYVVGLIVFVILVIINFLVITKGSGRIAEVAARFTLDAMPGKQMAIDADLNAGIIREDEAKRRRSEIAREADFYGAMDGASKFVRGDAIAGILITIVNIIAGLTIGVLQYGLPLAQAARTYTILTVGDGLVSQVPALMVSTAAGIVVSRAGAEAAMGQEFSRQFTLRPEALYLAGSIIFLFGLLPGLPRLPFMFIGLSVTAIAYMITRRAQLAGAAQLGRPATGGESAAAGGLPALPQGGGPGPVPSLPGPEKVEDLLALDNLELEVGYGLIPLVDDDQGGELLDRIRSIRRQFALESGFVVPPVHVRDNLQLRPGEYSLLIRGLEVARSEMMIGHLLAMNPGDGRPGVSGVTTTEPAFGLPALWIEENRRDEAQRAGWTVVDQATVVATHLTEVLKTHADELLSRQDVQKLLDNLSRTDEKVVEELVPNLLTLGQVQKVLQNLLRERVSIRDLGSIIEVLADHAPLTRDADLLTEFVRGRLARTILKPFETATGELPLMTLGQDIEETMTRSINESERGAYMALDPDSGQRILNAINKAMTELTEQNHQPVLLCSPMVRRHLRKLTERFIPNLAIISHGELTSEARLKIIGDVTFRYAE